MEHEVRWGPRMILANMVNELMTAVPGPAHAAGLNAVSPRKIWLSHPGDIVVTPRAVDEEFKQYASDLLGQSPQDVSFVSFTSPSPRPIAQTISEGHGLKSLTEVIGTRQEPVTLLPFALDRPTVRLAAALSLAIEGYDGLPFEQVLELAYSQNTKSGFLATARALGFDVPASRLAEERDLAQTVREMVALHGAVIIKLDRGSNGYGHMIIDQAGVNGADDLVALLRARNPAPEQPPRFLVEQLLDLVNVPSIEIQVDRDRVHVLYNCDQRCPNNSFNGMLSGKSGFTPQSYQRALDLTMKFGEHVRAAGYRGPCDVDFAVTTKGAVYATETNFRRTGGTYIDYLVKRLYGEDYEQFMVWAADVRKLDRAETFTSVLARLKRAGLALERGTRRGVILSVDTFAVDGKLRTITIGENQDDVLGIERELRSLLS